MPTTSIAATLHAALAAVCPIDGCAGPLTNPPASWTVYPAADNSKWRIDFDASATAQQQTAAIAALAAFNPAGPLVTGEATFEAALAAGIVLTWSSSTALNDSYPIDTATQVRMLAERVSVAVNSTFTNGTTTLTWYGLTGTVHTMSMTQAGLFVKAVWQYLTALFVARAVAASGGTPTWPSSSVSITG
jgi:hypothetical protein